MAIRIKKLLARESCDFNSFPLLVHIFIKNMTLTKQNRTIDCFDCILITLLLIVNLTNRIFRNNDKDGDKKLSRVELRALIRGMKLDEDGLMGIDDYVESTMTVFDSIPDDAIDEKEFTKAIFNWIKDTRYSETNQRHMPSNTSGNKDKVISLHYV